MNGTVSIFLEVSGSFGGLHRVKFISGVQRAFQGWILMGWCVCVMILIFSTRVPVFWELSLNVFLVCATRRVCESLNIFSFFFLALLLLIHLGTYYISVCFFSKQYYLTATETGD